MSRAIVEATQDKRDLVPEREQAVARLQEIPNVGPKMAAGLLKLGVTSLEDAAGGDPDEMYNELCAIDAKRHDPCVRDVFAAVVSYADGGYIMGGCAEELTDEEWKWLTLMLPPTETQNRSPRS
jgi:hypothetical protein